MDNRKKLSNTDIYDLLVSMNTMIIEKSFGETCVLEAIEKKHIDCQYFLCKECIQKYLDREVE